MTGPRPDRRGETVAVTRTEPIYGLLAAAATTDESLYTMDQQHQADVTVTVCNRTTGALTYRLAYVPSGDSLGTDTYLAYDRALAANDTHVWALTLDAGDNVRTYASASGITFILNGRQEPVK